MKKRLQNRIKTGLFRFDRKPIDNYPLDGFVIQIGKTLTLLQKLGSGLTLDGYCIFRNKDVKQWRELNINDHVAKRVLSKRGLRRKEVPGIDLSDLLSAVITINKKFPLLALHKEGRAQNVCWVGKLHSWDNNSVTFRLISPGAKKDEANKFKLSEITMVEFGGDYEKSLWLVCDHKVRKWLNTKIKSLKI